MRDTIDPTRAADQGLDALAEFARALAAGEAAPAPDPTQFAEGSSERALAESLRALAERLQAEQTRRIASEDRLALTVQGANDGMWDWDLTTNQVFFSPRWREMLGYEDEDPPLRSPAEWRALVHPEDRALAQAAIQAHLNQKAPAWDVEVRLRRRDGAYRWVRSRGAIQRDANGRPLRLVGVHTDVTERREAEAALEARLALENLVTELASRFITIAPDEIDAEIVEALGQAGRFAGVDLAHVFLFSEDGSVMLHGYGWHAPDITVPDEEKEVQPISDRVWLMEQIRRPAVVNVPRVDDLPEEAASERSVLQETGIRSLLGIPLTFGTDAIGMLVFASARAERAWGTETVALLQMVSSVIVNAIQRRRTELALREREEQYRAIVEAMSDGLIVHAMDGTIVEVNPAFCAMHGYRRDELLGRHPATLAGAGDQRYLARFLDAVSRGQDFRFETTDVRRDGSTFRVAVVGTRFTLRGRPHVLLLVRDITEQALAYELLEQRVQERTHELSTLLTVAGNVASTLELQPLLDLILDQLKQVVDYTAVSLNIIEGDALVRLRFRGPSLPGVADEVQRLPLETMGAFGEALSPREPVIMADVLHDDTPLARAYRAAMGEEQLRSQYAFLRSWMAVPLTQKGAWLGLLVLVSDTPNFYTPRHAALAAALASQVAVAIENARLYERSQRTAVELRTLLDVASNVASNLELRPLLNVVLDQVRDVAGYAGASVVLLEDGRLRQVERRAPVDDPPAVPESMAITRFAQMWEQLSRREPVIIDDVTDGSPLAVAYRQGVGVPLEESPYAYVRSWMAVPVALKDRVIGAISLAQAWPRAYTSHQAELVQAIASQAAVAIENARLYAQAHRLAALEERQRLARELHDSVSQALYGIGLGAHSALTLLDREPTRARAPVEYVLKLAQAGMAEMRALIFELRPESLETEGLVAAITKQAASLRARYDLEVETELCDEPETTLEVKEAIYRIAQEAMHNTVKHARATNVRLRLQCTDEVLSLEVTDDGVGFDPDGDYPGHLGLRSMQERVLRLNGRLVVDSAPGKGTRLSAEVHLR